MTADNAPLIASFLDHTFREENQRQLAESQITMQLEDFLYSLREEGGEELHPRSAISYLNDWAESDRGWLRKFYPPGAEEPWFDLTPASEKTLQWLESLFESSFVGTESRLYTVFRLLEEIVHGVETDKAARIKRLKKRRAEIDQEIKAAQAGELLMMDSREIKERFFQFDRTARELLSDFRMVEHNFRELDRRVRERIASWRGEKSELLGEIFGEHDAIGRSDQGQSFRAFWDFLMSPSSQEELTRMLDRVFSVEELGDLRQDRRLQRIHFDWMSAGEQTQRTVARLSAQLRRFLDDRAFHENRRIVELLESIERNALTVREQVPGGSFMKLDGWKPKITLPLDRPLFSVPEQLDIDSIIEEGELEMVDTSALFNQTFVDRLRLEENISRVLSRKGQASLGLVLNQEPLQEGLTELLTYFVIASEESRAFIDETRQERVSWQDREGRNREARIPLVIFSDTGAAGPDSDDEVKQKGWEKGE